MTREQALQLFGMTEADLTNKGLKDRYWERAKLANEQGHDLTNLNVAHELLEDEIARRQLPAIIDTNAALVKIIEKQARQQGEIRASDQLSSAVRSSIARITRKSRRMRDIAAVLGGLSAAGSFVISNLPEPFMGPEIVLALWGVFAEVRRWFPILWRPAHEGLENGEEQTAVLGHPPLLADVARLDPNQCILGERGESIGFGSGNAIECFV
jgi:hypothetical protein